MVERVHSSVWRKPSARETAGSKPRSSRALVITGVRYATSARDTPRTSTSGWVRVDANGIDYSATFDVTNPPSRIAAQTNLVPGAAPQSADIEILFAP